MLATSLPGTIGLLAADTLAIGQPDYAFRGDTGIFPLILWSFGLLVIAAPSVGMAQALVLKHLMRFPDLNIIRLWVGFSTLGVLLAMGMHFLVSSAVSPNVGFALFGVVIACTQWFILKRSSPKAGWWILINGFAWNTGRMAGGALVDALAPEGWFVLPYYPFNSMLYWALGWFVGTIVFSSITGFTLILLLREPHQHIRNV